MKVSIKTQQDLKEPYAVIYCESVTAEVRSAVALLEKNCDMITALDEGSIAVLERADIFMLRSEDGKTALYTAKKRFESAKPLKEFEALPGFIRISKSCVIALNKLSRVDAHFSGVMQVTLKNGLVDYISRKYLPEFKARLGL